MWNSTPRAACNAQRVSLYIIGTGRASADGNVAVDKPSSKDHNYDNTHTYTETHWDDFLLLEWVSTVSLSLSLCSYKLYNHFDTLVLNVRFEFNIFCDLAKLLNSMNDKEIEDRFLSTQISLYFLHQLINYISLGTVTKASGQGGGDWQRRWVERTQWQRGQTSCLGE